MNAVGAVSSGVPMRAGRTIALVARREFTTRARTRSFLVSNAVMLSLIFGGIIAASLIVRSSDHHTKLGLVGSAADLSDALAAIATAGDNPVDISVLSSEATARSMVKSGDLDVALLPQGSGGSYTAVVDSTVPPAVGSIIDAAVRQHAVDGALAVRGVDPAAVAQVAARAAVTVDAVNPPEPDGAQRTGLAYAALVLMFFQILVFGLYVAMGVVEEKSSRVVEVLLATIKPLHLLWGKVFGIGAVGLMQLAAYGAVGLGTGLGTGLITVTGTAIAVFASVFVWFVLGFVFYAVSYAAAGSLVSRQEDVNSVAAPITALIVASYLLAQATVQDPGGTVAGVMSWIPPFSAMLMPLRIAAGTTGALQIVGSVLLMLLVTVVLAMIAARIYERSVMHTGARLNWMRALRGHA